MNHKDPDDVTFQVTVDKLILSSRLPKQDVHVTVAVDDVSKITCPGEQSEDGLTVTWNHPFLFTAPLSVAVKVAAYILPEEFTVEWDKQPLGDQVVTDVAGLLQSGNTSPYTVPGLSGGSLSLFITCRAGGKLILPDTHACLSTLGEYSYKLYEVGGQIRNVSCMSTKIEVDLARLDLCSMDHPEHITILNDVAVSYQKRFDQKGNIADLNRAIKIQLARLDLCPLGHSEYTTTLGGLAMLLRRHYNIQQNKEDLLKLIEMQKRWLEISSSSHPLHPDALGEHAASLEACYDIWQDRKYLDRAIEMHEERLALCSIGHLDHARALNNLAVSIGSRYKKLGDLTDFNRSIGLKENFLELCPLGHPFHGIALQNLASSLLDHYHKMGDPSDLIRAIKLLKEASGIYPPHHNYFAFSATQLASAILHLFSSPKGSLPPDQQLPSLDEAFEAYRLLKKCGPAASLNLWDATQNWTWNAERYNHPSALEAYQTSLNTLDHFSSLTSSLDSRHETMQKRVANLANDAFSCALRHDNPQMAIELLEQGRGILWNQLARFDMSISALESHSDGGRELGRKFTRLSADLKKHAQRSGGQGSNLYWEVQEQWQSVVDSIRRLDGFSRFLLPPRFEDLQQAAEHGPVIIVSASEYGCDALIVLYDGAPIHVPLRCSLDDVVQLCSQLSELTQVSHAYGPHRELYVKEVLRDLWSSVVERIVRVLQNDAQLPLGSRIWWCPTSKFTMLPFHAAGPHRKAKKNLMDIYVSSYAPSLSALLRARDRIRSEKEARHASGTAKTVSFATVGQAHPSADTKLGELPEVEHEIHRIRDETGMPPSVKFETVTGAAASIEGAVRAFRDHHWVHVASHGAQHAEKPFDSWFAMGDGKLTLMRIIRERFTTSEFAFLSACHTAVGDATTPDEVLHLAAGMQFAGFNGVVGTLWKVDDSVAHQMVTRFYQEMFKHQDVGFEHAAAALNTAALATADEVSLEKRIVFVHIGI